MNRRLIPYLPPSYLQMRSESCALWHSSDEPAEHLSLLTELAHDALAFLVAELAFVPRRALHLCCFRTNAEACSTLDRTFPATMALAPFAGDGAGLVVVQSPEASPENGDRERMRRILVHEFAHLLAMEATGSRKILGDENRTMQLPSWLNEGLAEVCAFRGIGHVGHLDHLVRDFERRGLHHTFGDLNAMLDDLGSADRGKAFEHATAAVESIAREIGLGRVFARLGDLSLAFCPQQVCSPSTLSEIGMAETS